MSQQRVYFLVHGTVQGVSFRYFTRSKAMTANITGWVRNTENEKVEGEAQGSTEAIKQFLKDIDNGPTHAHVVRLDKEDREIIDGEADFEIRH